MARAKFINKRPVNLEVLKKTLKSKFLVLAILSVPAVVAALIVVADLGICQQATREVPSRGKALTDGTWCDELDVLVISHDPQDTVIVCVGARGAIVFLESHGLDVTRY
jgi:hypothetical protein